MFDVDLHDCEDVDLQRLARGLHDYTDLFGDLNSPRPVLTQKKKTWAMRSQPDDT
jgi:hypothetical protein